MNNGAWLMSNSRWTIQMVSSKGSFFNRAKNAILRGEGIVMRFPSDREEDQSRENVRVWTQSRNISDLASKVGDFLEMSGRMCCGA